jgi:uncharacterized RDD family membrane protein YckC
MMNDTVREELETKITMAAEPIVPRERPAPPKPAITQKPKQTGPPTSVIASPTPPPPPTPTPTHVPSKPIAHRFDTADLRVKKTSPTLVEFQTKKATVPEWRLQLQNSVRQKVGTNRRSDGSADGPHTNQQKQKTTSGANALKVGFVEEEQQTRHQNPRVASALKRIEESRRVFSNQPVAEQSVQVGKTSTPRNFPFNVVARSSEASAQNAAQRATVNPSPKPMLVSPLKIEKRGFDTNKLPPLPKQGKISSRLEVPAAKPPEATRTASGSNAVEEKAIERDLLETTVEETDEIEDLAPLSMRFNAGLFDMIIGLFGTLILLSPFMLSGGTWMSVPGILAIAAAVAIVMFLYLTISIAFVGRTFGMRLFSLELVDVEENAYPTLHQAAVSSAVYLLSLALAGIGFLPVFFNEERRATHDILSGTILLREY